MVYLALPIKNGDFSIKTGGSFHDSQVMLMLRRLHSDLSEGGGSPRHGGYRAAAPVATGAEGGGIIDSALTPLSGTWMRFLPVERAFEWWF